eukprot:6051544-Pyramimonas_sp.AAC.1
MCIRDSAPTFEQVIAEDEAHLRRLEREPIALQDRVYTWRGEPITLQGRVYTWGGSHSPSECPRPSL